MLILGYKWCVCLTLSHILSTHDCSASAWLPDCQQQWHMAHGTHSLILNINFASTNESIAESQMSNYSKTKISSLPHATCYEEYSFWCNAVKKTRLNISKCFIYEANMKHILEKICSVYQAIYLLFWDIWSIKLLCNGRLYAWSYLLSVKVYHD